MRLRARAKINRSLLVTGTRSDGFHELETVFQSIALHDTLSFEASDRFELVCAAPGIPLDERNLVWQAAVAVWTAAGRAGHPAGRARILKRIPAQGGLGGGSADGAAALVGWDRLWNTRLDRGCLHELACRLGADVPFFLVGGTALGLDRGDVLYPMEDLPARWVVLVFPPFGVSTPEAFRWWDHDLAEAAPDAGLGRQGVGRRRPGPLGCTNDLEGPVARRHPDLLEIKRALADSGAEAAAMTGSGSTMFGLFDAEDAGRSAAASLASRGWRTLLTRTATRRQSRL